MNIISKDSEKELYNHAFWLSIYTILFNSLEGIVSVILGYNDGTVTLFGFGADSFIEVLSGIGILVMVLRIKKNPVSFKSKFEITALQITGTAFFMLSAGLLYSILHNLLNHHQPESTSWGVIISIISIYVMYWLMDAKKNVGKQLNSDPLIADANCSKICIYMSVILFVSSLIFAFTGFAYADILGAAGLMCFSIIEGKEAFDKAHGKICGCDDCEK